VDSLDCSLASVSSAHLASPSETPRSLSQSLSSCQPCVFGASDLVSDDEVPCLHVPSTRQPTARAATTSLADSDDELSISPRSALVLCDSDDEVPVPRPMLSCPSSTSRPFVRPAPQACGRCPLGYG
jgi:hypothetical protein